MDDNFVQLANAINSDNEISQEESDQVSDVSSEGHMELSDEERDEVCSLNRSEYTFKKKKQNPVLQNIQ